MSQEAGLPPLEGDAHVVRFAPSVDLIAGARQHIKLLWAVHLVKENYLYKARSHLQSFLLYLRVRHLSGPAEYAVLSRSRRTFN